MRWILTLVFAWVFVGFAPEANAQVDSGTYGPPGNQVEITVSTNIYGDATVTYTHNGVSKTTDGVQGQGPPDTASRANQATFSDNRQYRISGGEVQWSWVGEGAWAPLRKTDDDDPINEVRPIWFSLHPSSAVDVLCAAIPLAGSVRRGVAS